MLSFFSKKKHSPETPPEEIIQGPAEPPKSSNGEEYVFVEKRADDSPKGADLYPPINNFNLPYPMPNVPTVSGSTASINPLQGVPFQLAPQLHGKKVYDAIQTQVDGILALLTRQMSINDNLVEEYNFSLERSIQSESHW